ncbi:hypothetical protein T265_03252 [Opisthorchis viverrini]|uniref:Uncharacterized protein n=1 Tax=Opisthorchis viverrini TaxID=6198 RepID=A0A075AHQ7_OPIVI|nr:hypothetical protein T265_03252 [Opisthorchis viverrini]KER30304.1 hypothetical protein T265_03252 [Opisthorchis viverrini]
MSSYVGFRHEETGPYRGVTSSIGRRRSRDTQSMAWQRNLKAVVSQISRVGNCRTTGGVKQMFIRHGEYVAQPTMLLHQSHQLHFVAFTFYDTG